MIRTLSLAFFLSWLIPAAHAQYENDPVAYLEIYNQLHGEIISSNLDFLQHSVHSEQPREVGEMRLKLITRILSGIEQLDRIEAYPDDAGMRTEMLEVLKTYLNIFKVDFEHVEKLLANSQDSYQAMEDYMQARTQAESRLAAANDRFHTATEAFAQANQIRLVKGDPDSEIAQLNRLSKYKDQVFLSVFRIKKRNDEFRQAMQREDVSAMRDSRESLLEEAKEELTTLREVPAFNDNVAYRDAAIAEIEGIAEVAERYYPAFIRVKDQPNSELGQADVDAYNAAVDATNSLFPSLNQATNEARKQLLRDNVPRPTLRGTKRI